MLYLLFLSCALSFKSGYNINSIDFGTFLFFRTSDSTGSRPIQLGIFVFAPCPPLNCFQKTNKLFFKISMPVFILYCLLPYISFAFFHLFSLSTFFFLFSFTQIYFPLNPQSQIPKLAKFFRSRYFLLLFFKTL